MTKKDRAALELAMEYARRDPGRAEQLDSKLKGLRYEDPRIGKWIMRPEPWAEVAEFAAYCAQSDTLQLKPHEAPPCNGDPDGERPQDKLLARMLAAGVSRYHPDPLAALAELKNERQL